MQSRGWRLSSRRGCFITRGHDDILKGSFIVTGCFFDRPFFTRYTVKDFKFNLTALSSFEKWMGCKNNDVAAHDGNRKNLRKIRTIIRKEKLGIRRLSKIGKNSITSEPLPPHPLINILSVAKTENSVSFWHIAIRISIICKENGKHIVTLCSWLFFPKPFGGCLHHPVSLPAVIVIPPNSTPNRTPQSIGNSKQSDVKQQSAQQLRPCNNITIGLASRVNLIVLLLLQFEYSRNIIILSHSPLFSSCPGQFIATVWVCV